MNKKVTISLLLVAICFGLTAYSYEIKWGVYVFSENPQLQAGSYKLNSGASFLAAISSNATYTLTAGVSSGYQYLIWA